MTAGEARSTGHKANHASDAHCAPGSRSTRGHHSTQVRGRPMTGRARRATADDFMELLR
jgi:hypothetical protein